MSDLPLILRRKADVLSFCNEHPTWLLEWCMGVGHSWFWLRPPEGAHFDTVKVDKRALPRAFMAAYFVQTKATWRNRLYRFVP